jgi:hypothetical protein
MLAWTEFQSRKERLASFETNGDTKTLSVFAANENPIYLEGDQP